MVPETVAKQLPYLEICMALAGLEVLLDRMDDEEFVMDVLHSYLSNLTERQRSRPNNIQIDWIYSQYNPQNASVCLR